MNILLTGAGSIGKRHINNLLSLGYTNISVIARSGLLPEFPSLTIYKNIAAALHEISFDAAFICTPTSRHIDDLFELLRAKIENIYVEKPLSHNTEKISEILKLASSYHNNIVVGYDLHFDPGIQKVRDLLRENLVGKTVSVNAFVGQYLPHWRPYEDHRKGMSARKETGGGVLLDIVHEFDYLCWLTGKVVSVAGLYTNSGSLEIETEETAEVLLKFADGVIGSVHLDYLQPSLVRYFIITGTQGTITCDVAKKRVTWVTHNNTTGEFVYDSFERNDRFKEIVTAFLKNPADERLTSLQDALQSLQIIMAAKYSAEHSCIVNLADIKYQ